MGKKNDFIYVDDVGLFRTREAAMIYDYFRTNAQDDQSEIFTWIWLRDALYGELAFMEHDEYVLFEMEVLNPSLAEIQKRTGELIVIADEGKDDEGEERIRLVRKQA